ncbi:threonine synthase [Anaeromyxobacter dehalogenans 2CP-1]|uniref:Threonine synthase n=1 Tax=Anaeromyxobacter dehalogenans (strain ATCC BAA-258 / DSM 21875 / 2CP-1) TaxID=455488 RepID=B8J9E6_ANAD2|nr:threonine synthase [Anaeromyxobacter dehalogenans]ACL65552.1 threonine synthase [Anaeromyxobacter dehalogenans 2CP-1]
MAAPAFSSWFRCADGCDFRAELTEVVYECPRCGGLLEVEHDRAALATRSAAEWKALFDGRFKLGAWPYGSGVWGKKEWVYPGIADANVVSMFEGGSPLLRIDRYARELGLDDVWLKECGVTHTGSFKDLGMTVLVSAVKEMRARGAAVRAVACASTGDTSAALSAYCAAAGIPSVVLLPRGKISTAQLVQPISNGALVLELDTDFDGCMQVVKQLSRTKDIYLANSMNSLRIEGQKTASIEIAQQLGWTSPDWIVIPGGNLGNASAVGKGFLLMKELGVVDRLPRLVVAQAEHANPLWRATTGAGVKPTAAVEVAPLAARKTLASAIQIGAPVSARRALRALEALDGVVEQASEQELADAAARADRAGMFTCPHTGVALAALEKLAARGVVKRGERVVVISTAHGLKFSDFKVGYHDQTLPGIRAGLRNPAVQLPATLGAVQDAIAGRFGRG